MKHLLHKEICVLFQNQRSPGKLYHAPLYVGLKLGSDEVDTSDRPPNYFITFPTTPLGRPWGADSVLAWGAASRCSWESKCKGRAWERHSQKAMPLEAVCPWPGSPHLTDPWFERLGSEASHTDTETHEPPPRGDPEGPRGSPLQARVNSERKSSGSCHEKAVAMRRQPTLNTQFQNDMNSRLQGETVRATTGKTTNYLLLFFPKCGQMIKHSDMYYN